MATGSAAYNELYYSGAETNYIGAGFWVGQEVRNANGIITSEKAHTGKYSIKATDASQFGAYMRNGHRPGKYKLSVWVHKDNAANARVRATQYGTPTPFNGSSYPAGDWVLMTHTFDVVAGDFYPYVTSANSSEVYFDDLMIRPIASSMTGYVYNEFDELTHIIGNNGLATRFEYDAAGRLVKTYVEVIDDAANGINGGFKLQSENKINYRNLN
jgi:YD repeat-containing protein